MTKTEDHRKQIPRLHRGVYDRRNDSRKAAVRAFCLECVCWVMDEVRDCTAPQCPLYKWRLRG